MSADIILAIVFLLFGAWLMTDSIRLLVFRRPSRGTVIATSYSEAERTAARDAHRWDWLYKVTAGNKKPVVEDILTIEYEARGRRYRRRFETAHTRGDRADRAPTIWYDPADPERATLDGPGGTALVALGLLGLAAWTAGLL